jgi:hypothetical protein
MQKVNSKIRIAFLFAACFIAIPTHLQGNEESTENNKKNIFSEITEKIVYEVKLQKRKQQVESVITPIILPTAKIIVFIEEKAHMTADAINKAARDPENHKKIAETAKKLTTLAKKKREELAQILKNLSDKD